MKYYIIAGEASGDLHASNLIKGITRHDPRAQCRGWGGDLMQAAGCTIVRHYKDTAIMGFLTVLRHLGTIRRNLFWACVYNAVGIPLAAGALFPVWGVMLTPGVSAACMAFSSVSVVTSSLLLARCRI